jgi:hypothetical protein
VYVATQVAGKFTTILLLSRKIKIYSQLPVISAPTCRLFGFIFGETLYSPFNLRVFSSSLEGMDFNISLAWGNDS